jgi:hypothetical protein
VPKSWNGETVWRRRGEGGGWWRAQGIANTPDRKEKGTAKKGQIGRESLEKEIVNGKVGRGGGGQQQQQ